MYNQNTIVINLKKKNTSSNDPENHGKQIIYIDIVAL